MRIAFFTYPQAFQNPGGGEVQLLKTREALVSLGVTVDLFDPWGSRVEDYDVLHVFSSVKDCLGLAETARGRGVKVVTSPVLWSDWRRALRCEGLRQKADLAARHAAKWLFPRFPSGRRRLLETSHVLFPNSEAEKNQLMRLFAMPASKIRVVPNGVDARFASADPGPFKRKMGDDRFVLAVGRIEPRKNQLNLLRALRGAGVKLVQIGSPVTGYERYASECLKAGEGFATFLPTLSHDDAMLASAYAACSAFVLQGWFETPGLAALEAGLAGAPLAVTSGGATREYFGPDVEYFDPADPADIRRKTLAALGRGRGGALPARLLERYSWQAVGRATLAGYEEAMRLA